MKNSVLYYSVGPLLYCPANNAGIADSIVGERFGRHFSLALCLEDTINDSCVEEAEDILTNTIKRIHAASSAREFYLPKIFIRVRSPKQIGTLLERFAEAREVVTGFNVPKFSPENADAYINSVVSANESGRQPVYLMPIFESSSMVSLQDRSDILYRLKDKLDRIEDLVLNIRVGGNDLCHLFGFRRHSDESIHSIRPISNLFSDIITVYGIDYVISGPVWEYYDGDGWDKGLASELQEDKLFGFTGKTVIHPKQIDLVNRAYQVTAKDLEDAKSILDWDTSSHSFVSGSVSKERMNEYKTHSNWALRTILLAEAYGVKQ